MGSANITWGAKSPKLWDTQALKDHYYRCDGVPALSSGIVPLLPQNEIYFPPCLSLAARPPQRLPSIAVSLGVLQFPVEVPPPENLL